VQVDPRCEPIIGELLQWNRNRFQRFSVSPVHGYAPLRSVEELLVESEVRVQVDRQDFEEVFLPLWARNADLPWRDNNELIRKHGEIAGRVHDDVRRPADLDR
jgi:hypothetical protein